MGQSGDHRMQNDKSSFLVVVLMFFASALLEGSSVDIQGVGACLLSSGLSSSSGEQNKIGEAANVDPRFCVALII